MFSPQTTKLLRSKISTIHVILRSFVGVLLPTLPIVLYRQETVFPPGKRIILLLRCFVGTTGLMLSFYAFRHMPLADASVIIFSTPVFVAIFARLFLREPCGTFNVVTIVLTLFGVVLITRPPLLFASSAVPSLDAAASSLGSRMMGTDDAAADAAAAVLSDERAAAAAGGGGLWGPVAALSSTLFGANAYVLLRALKGLHFSVIMTNFGAFALVYTMLVSWWLGALCWPQCGSDRWMVVALAVFSFLGQILLTLSLQLEQAGPVAIARSADIVFAFVWQVLFFGEIPNVYSVAGAVLVVSSVVLTGFRKWALALPRESNVRQRVRWLLMLDK